MAPLQEQMLVLYDAQRGFSVNNIYIKEGNSFPYSHTKNGTIFPFHKNIHCVFLKNELLVYDLGRDKILQQQPPSPCAPTALL